ncbi:MAG: addiction module antidote protein, HigA family [Burkholderiales bacterium]|nr:MAG: addiction module antidote protein, HigA family [Burkholderiales bacterium]
MTAKRPSKSRVRMSHPGAILRDNFLKTHGLSVYRVAKEIGVPLPRLNDIILAKRGISAEMGVLLARYFGTSEDFFVNLQGDFDRRNAERALKVRLAAIRPVVCRRN